MKAYNNLYSCLKKDVWIKNPDIQMVILDTSV